MMKRASVGLSAFVLACSVAWMSNGPAEAAPPAGDRTSIRPAAGSSIGDTDTPWSSLTPAARSALAPLERDWTQLSGSQKLKWVELAHRLPAMNPDQQQRIRGRMAEWARLTPAERSDARLRFIQSQRTGTGVEDREQRWDAYQALPNEQKKQFAARAAALPASATPAQKPRAGKPAPADRGDIGVPTAKSNLVSNPNFAAQPQAIYPGMLKAGPGASTTTVTKPPTPPAHQQTGLPKIAATPGFVDKATLLPKRGAQGAAATPLADDAEAAPVPRP